jgi:hypothetical protein
MTKKNSFFNSTRLDAFKKKLKWIYSSQLCYLDGISDKNCDKSEKRRKSLFFDRKLAARDSNVEKSLFLLIVPKIESFSEKV